MSEADIHIEDKREEKQPGGKTFSLARVWFHFTIVLLLLALFQAQRLAASLEDLAADLAVRFSDGPVVEYIVPAINEMAHGLRLAADNSGIAYAGEQVSKVISLGTTDKIIGKIEAAPVVLAVDGKENPSFHSGDEQPDASGSLVSSEAPVRLAATNATMTPTEADGEKSGTLFPSVNATSIGRINEILPSQNATGVMPEINATSTASAANATNATAEVPDCDEDEDKPLVLLVGDSLMMEGLGPALLKELRGRDDLEVVREAKYSTGLSRKDYFDWPAYMEELVEKYDPDVVIITLGGNDAQDIIDDDKKRHIAGTPSWEEQYELRAKALVAAAQKNGAYVLWVGLPVMGNATHAKRTLLLSERQKAACSTNSTSQLYVDTLELLANDKGEFIAFIKNEEGKQIRIRYKDKIHVTTAGGEILVKEVVPCLEEMLKARAGEEQAEG